MTLQPLPSGVYGGVTAMRRTAGVVTLVETTYEADVSLARHRHERPYFCYVVHGTFHEQSGGRSRLSRRGDLIFHPAGETHADRFGSHGGICFNIEVAPASLEGLESSALTQTEHAVELRGGLASRLAADAHREFHRAGRASDLVVEGLALALLGEASRAWPARRGALPPPWLARAVEILHDRFREPMTLEAIASDVGVHPVHLARTFRRHKGVTVGEFMRVLRMGFACAELRAGRRPVGEIAHASGFADHAHFCRAFRARFGMSPTRYRALHTAH